MAEDKLDGQIKSIQVPVEVVIIVAITLICFVAVAAMFVN